MESLPEEILFHILLWLPVISLLRFKSVCKSWLTLIESSTFVNQHLRHRSGENALIVSLMWSHLDFGMFSGNKYEIYTDINFDDRFRTSISKEYDVVGEHDVVNLVDSCDGIICLHNARSWDVALWNPAMRQLRILPRSSIPLQHYIPGTDWQYKIIGFGFDVKANDYKVVRIVYTRPEINQVEVYSLRTSLSWRIVRKNEALPFRRLNEYSGHATSNDGTCFWLGEADDDDDESLLVAFDLKNEVFKTMPLPDCCGSKSGASALDFLNEKLAYSKGLNDGFGIWVLHEFGLKESWNKIYNIGRTPYTLEYLRPIGFSRNGNFILLQPHDDWALYFCDFCTEVASRLSCTRIRSPDYWSVHSFLHYNESLISLKS